MMWVDCGEKIDLQMTDLSFHSLLYHNILHIFQKAV